MAEMTKIIIAGGLLTCSITWALPLPVQHLRVVKEYFVSPTGSSSNLATAGSPWPVNYALSRAQSGDVISLVPGTYPSIVVRTPGVILRSTAKWAATVAGSPGLHGIQVDATNVVIDGVEVSHSYIDGIKLNSSGNTVRNCWIHHSGLGDPNAVVNTNASYTGQGIYSGCYANNTIEKNLIEYNGIWIAHDHGVYIAGTNNIIRGNVLRHNWAYGLQLFSGYAGESCCAIQVYNNLIYGNGVCDAGRNCLTVWAGPPGSGVMTTNYVFNNTLVADTYYPVICDSGYLGLSNNIILGAYDGTLIAVDGGTIWSSYNCFTNAVRASDVVVDGGHNVVATNPGFVNAANGLFWLTSTSPARGSANKTLIPPIDFFGNSQSSCNDAGAFQYNALYETDTRILEPSPAYPDYWFIK